jgi:hypothetical protein
VREMLGNKRKISTTAYYVPEASIRLFSPQTYFKEKKAGSLHITHDLTTLTLKDGSQLYFPYQEKNLPLMLTDEHFTRKALTVGLTFEDATVMATMDVNEEMNQNLTSPQRELMFWNQKWAHCDLGRVQTFLAIPRDDSSPRVIAPKHAKASYCPKPKCAACCLSKTGCASARCHKSRRRCSPRSVHVRLARLSPYYMWEGEAQNKYTGGTVFVDGRNGFIHHHHQVSLRVGETLKGKNRFEKGSAQFHVQIKSFRADNAPFNAAEFKNDLENKGRTISLSGVGAHHQKGAAERAIKTITSWARTMMLHAILHWQEQTTLDLWLFAMDHVVYCWNHLPSKNEIISPLEAFTGTRFSNYEHFKRLHVWGSPCYVLNPRLQDEKKIPRWAPRCRQGQYLGISLDHSTTAARILNTRTGYVSPQYHVLHDDSFTTVVSTGVPWTHVMPLQWNTLLQSGYERYLDLDYDRSGHLVPAPMLSE